MICTVTPITNSKQVENYYTRDDYYSRDAKRDDFWQGKLADKFSLKNKSVHKNHFASLIKLTSERKNCGNSKPTLGVDLTFSCPKSVSILQAVSPEYREIVNRCLAETTEELIDFIEKNFVRTRRGHGGSILEYTKNILAASINHEVNRNDELDRHTHIFIPNMTQTKDGKILTIDIKFLMQQQKLFGAVAHSKLAEKLQCEGIELEFDNPDKGTYRVKGISRDIEEHFSKRSADIFQELKKFGNVTPASKQLATLKTRKAKNHKVNLDKIFQSTSDFLKKSEINIQQQEKIAPADFSTKKKIFNDVLSQMELKYFAFSSSDIIQNVLSAGLIAQIQFDEVNKFINQSKKNSTF